VQRQLGSDIAVTLDDCPSLPAPRERIALAVERTARWGERCRDAHNGGQALFGVVQGGTDRELRARSAEAATSIGFDGYCIGGLSVGESREEMAATLGALEPHLPLDSPRYLMGVGDPLGIVAAVSAGVDLFDSVWPTRQARHGHALTDGGRLSIKRAEWARSDEPLEDGCTCEGCRTVSRGALRHLFSVGEPLAARLLTIHNLSFLGRFMARVRTAIRESRLADLAADLDPVLGGPPSNIGQPASGQLLT
jgi:queuine tRNA-ribosyltransferase